MLGFIDFPANVGAYFNDAMQWLLGILRHLGGWG